MDALDLAVKDRIRVNLLSAPSVQSVGEIDEMPVKQVYTAHLAIIGSHSTIDCPRRSFTDRVSVGAACIDGVSP
jgi:hypothetical protein